MAIDYRAGFRSREPAMNAFYEHHKDSIRFGYRCFDRILLNGLIPTVSAARESGRVLQYLSAPLSGQPRRAAWRRRPVSGLGEGTVRQVERPDRRGSKGSPR